MATSRAGRRRRDRSGEQREGQARRRQLVGDGAEEAGRDLVGEGVLRRVGEQHADGAGRPAGEGRAAGSGPTYPSSSAVAEDPVAQLARQLVRSGERVRHGHPADPDPVGDRLQRHSRQAHPPGTAPGGRTGRPPQSRVAAGRHDRSAVPRRRAAARRFRSHRRRSTYGCWGAYEARCGRCRYCST